MRQFHFAIGYLFATVYGSDAWGQEPAGWGPAWATSAGAPTGQLEIKPLKIGVPMWVDVSLVGEHVTKGWTEGPYTSQDGSLVLVQVDLSDANASHLVQVLVDVKAVDPTTGDDISSSTASPLFLIGADTAKPYLCLASPQTQDSTHDSSDGTVDDGAVVLQIEESQ